MWILAAAGSAAFAGVTAILSKCGIRRTGSRVATAIRTAVVLLFAWGIVWLTGAYRELPGIGGRSWCFLILSGMATGASWLCYFRALSLGEVSRVAAVDKSSVVLSVLLAMLIFPQERTLWWGKLICLALIAAGTLLISGLPRGRKQGEHLWFFFALLSAVFAAATSLLAKVGMQGVNSNLATAIRTGVVLLLAWGIILGTGEWREVRQVTGGELLLLILSGVATGVSWLCYYYAIQQGQVSVVVPIDKLSILLTVLFSVTVLRERLTGRAWLGLGLLTAGTVLMALLA